MHVRINGRSGFRYGFLANAGRSIGVQYGHRVVRGLKHVYHFRELPLAVAWKGDRYFLSGGIKKGRWDRKHPLPYQGELSRAEELAEDIGRVRLQMDTQAALARLLAAQGQGDAAQYRDAKARAIAEAIGKSLASSGLEARLRVS